jgi:hypothetical protein
MKGVATPAGTARTLGAGAAAILLSAALFLAAAPPAGALGLLGFQVVVGATNTQLSDLNATHTSNNDVGFDAGVNLNLGHGILFIRPGLHYRSLGFDLEETSPTRISDGVRVAGMYVPLMAGVGFNLGPIAAKAGGGPTLQFVGDVDGNDFGLNTDNVTGSYWGFRLMGQARIAMFEAELGYEQGLSNLLDDEARFGGSKPDTWSLGLGFLF